MDGPAASIIVSALISGAAAVGKDTASHAVIEAYNGLKGLVKRRFLGTPAAEIALDECEKDSETWEKPLAKAIAEHACDKEILALAQQFLELLQAQEGSSSKYNVNIKQGQGTVIGDHAQVTQQFGDQPLDKVEKFD